MIETFFFLLGLGFSILVYVRTIKAAEYSRLRKLFYFLVSSFGITGILFLFGILIADRFRNLNWISR